MKAFTITLPRIKSRNPLAATCTGKSQTMKDRRTRRSKDARKSWKNEEY